MRMFSIENVELSDGQKMAVRRWGPPSEVASKDAVVALHGLMTHAGWFHAIGECLARMGIALYALDRRGSGTHRHLPGLEDGESWVRDIHSVLDFARARHERASLFCWCGGAAPGIVAASRYPNLHRLFYAAPALMFHSGIQQKMGEWLSSTADELPLPFDPLDDFSDDPTVRMYIDQDPLRWRTVPRGFIKPGLSLKNLAMELAPKIKVPTMTFLASRDTLVNNEKTRELLQKSSAVSEVDGCHAIVVEQPRQMATLVENFLSAH